MKPFHPNRRVVCLFLCGTLLVSTTIIPSASSVAASVSTSSSQSAPSTDQLDEQTRVLLEDSLSVHELDQEIARVQQEQQTAQHHYRQLEKDLVVRQHDLDQARQQSDRVLIAYYTGEREQLWAALFSTGSLSGMITFYEYYRMIIDHDHDIMQSYQQQYNDLQSKRNELANTSAELQQIGTRLQEQKTRVVSLQSRIHQGLAGSSNAEVTRQLMDEFNSYWENVGLYEVKNYFRILARSMDQFPSFLQSQPDAIQMNGRNYTITISEQQLNDFLHQQGGMPDSFQFHFTDQGIVVNGSEGNLKLEITGHYEVEEQPQNALRFRVDGLVFNGLRLPDTTSQTLENQFDLGFYPGQIISYLKARQVIMTGQTMRIELQLSL
ncbi:hypothetical protein ACE3MZ_16275 [Paenibacillus sp. WLX1005]|uniref:hypothetical protein n=1 Tax=Paenibacillus sp. WLX1005 TaxID=3243766 RepID=UPI0039843399